MIIDFILWMVFRDVRDGLRRHYLDGSYGSYRSYRSYRSYKPRSEGDNEMGKKQKGKKTKNPKPGNKSKDKGK